MNKLLKLISYLFHPLVMPLLGVIFYFSKTPRFTPPKVVYAKIISISILTILLPILLFFLLRAFKKVDSIHLTTTSERRWPLLINCMIILLIVNRVLPRDEIPELYFFFLGILISTITCLALALAKFKASIHMIGAAGFFMFSIALGIHFKININTTLIIMCIVMGAIATSRLHLNAHNNVELGIGFFAGLLPQLIILNYWM